MTDLELKKLKLELVKVRAARAEQEYRIDERLDEINRLKGHIDIQLKREDELLAQIAAQETATENK